MIIWLNETFGAGKTTAATELTNLLPQSRMFDTEEVGLMLRQVLATETVRDFQDWQPWRGLVIAAATQILDYVGGILVIPQSVLVHQYWQEIRSGLENASVPVLHFVLHAERDELLRRIETDPTKPNSTWRLEHLDDYDAARSWHSQEAHIIDTTCGRPTSRNWLPPTSITPAQQRRINLDELTIWLRFNDKPTHLRLPPKISHPGHSG